MDPIKLEYLEAKTLGEILETPPELQIPTPERHKVEATRPPGIIESFRRAVFKGTELTRSNQMDYEEFVRVIDMPPQI